MQQQLKVKESPMSRKPLKGNGNSNGAIAPANLTDFPLSSPQSRAAARALFTRKNALSQDDEDALTLCSDPSAIAFHCFLSAAVALSPSPHRHGGSTL
jgi:hypothetical protein